MRTHLSPMPAVDTLPEGSATWREYRPLFVSVCGGDVGGGDAGILRFSQVWLARTVQTRIRG